MSAEAPRNSGTGEPIPPQRSKDGFSGFFKGLFAVPSTTVIKPPPGLEGFAANIQQEIDNHLATVRQQETERTNDEAASIVATAVLEAKAAERQRELERQERLRKGVSIREASRILQEFRIADRLKIIQQTAWEGKGQIRPIDHYLSLGTGGYELGGFELVHQYPSYTTETVGDLCRGRWRYVPHTDSTRLTVAVRGKFLTIKSFETESLEHVAIEVVIPIDAEDSNNLLAAALTKETVDRIANQGLPSQVEKRAWEKLSRLPHWRKWNRYYDRNYDPSGPD